jgi:hypothetical protein
MVAMAMALVVTTSALGLMLMAIKTQREGTARQALSRDAQLVMDTIKRDLAHLGAGVPRGFAVDTDGDLLGLPNVKPRRATVAQLNGLAANQLRPAVRIGAPSYLAFLGDLPFPHSDLNGLANLGVPRGSKLGKARAFGISSELSTCTAPAAGASNYICDTKQNTMLHNPGGTPCSSSATGEPTCPWGLGKYGRPGLATTSAPVTVVAGVVDGSWLPRKWDGSIIGNTQRAMMQFTPDFPAGGSGTLNDERISTDLIIGDRIGGGFLAHLDRVFYAYQCIAGSCSLSRKQCWGWDLDTLPSNSGFPGVGATPILPGTDPADCAAPADGTPWESVMEGFSSFTFRYFDALGAELTGTWSPALASRTRVIEVEFTLERRLKVDAPPFGVTLSRRFYLEHAGGLVSNPVRATVANGGCWEAGPNYECNPQ